WWSRGSWSRLVFLCRDVNNALIKAKRHGLLGDLTLVDPVMVRDIFGDPFRSCTIDSAWLTSIVLSLTRTIYDERAFDRMPILGDALEEAGCDNKDMLDHCRQLDDHVRGCWVIDLLLGKE